MRGIDAAALLLYAFGTYAFGAALFLWARQRAGARKATIGLPTGVEGLISGLSLAWFVACMLLTLRNTLPDSRPYVLQSVLLCLAFCFPPTILHAFAAAARAEGRLGRPRAWRAGLFAYYTTSGAVATTALVGYWVGIGLAPRQVALGANVVLASSFTVAAVLSARLLVRASEPRPHDRTARRWMLSLLGAVVLLSAFIVLLETGKVPFGEVVAMLLRAIPLMFLLVGTYFDDRFVFFDRFLKGGVLLVVSALLLAGTLAGAERFLRPLPLGGARPWVMALALLPVAGALPSLSRVLGRGVDAVWLGRRWHPVEAVERFFAALQRATDEPTLLRAAEGELALLFRAPAAILASAPFDPAPAGVLEASLPLPGGEQGRVRVGPRADLVPLLSEDAAMLSTLAKVLASALATVRLQARERELILHAGQAELKALHAQIRPHFLFNALNAVAGLIRKDPALADRTVERLADVLRYTLRRSESGFASLKDELEFVRAYLEVEHARFGERLRFTIEVAPALEGLQVPTMTLQTLVENAVKHGTAARREGGQVAVIADLDGTSLRLRVEDDGPGPRSGKRSLDAGGLGGYGLDNLARRLAACYGSAGTVDLRRDAERGVTVACVTLPAAAAVSAGGAR